MVYLWLKFTHIVSSTLLFGTGIGTASVMLYAHRTKDTKIISAVTRYVVLADWLFTGSSGIVQPFTGLAMVYIAGYSISQWWILGAIIGYLVAGLCWLPVVYLQIKMKQISHEALAAGEALPMKYYFYFKVWFVLGWPAFMSLIIVFYLMTVKPI